MKIIKESKPIHIKNTRELAIGTVIMDNDRDVFIKIDTGRFVMLGNLRGDSVLDIGETLTLNGDHPYTVIDKSEIHITV